MRGKFWFSVGAAAATYVIFRGQKAYQEYVPEPLRNEIAKRTDDAMIDLGRFSATFRAAMDEREAEIRAELDIPEQ